MRATLEELKAMSDDDLHKYWAIGGFPFELANCGACLTQHTYTSYMPCKNLHHLQFIGRIKATIGDNADIPQVRAHLEELLALRLYFDSLYPQPAEPEPASELIPEQEMESVT